MRRETREKIAKLVDLREQAPARGPSLLPEDERLELAPESSRDLATATEKAV
jgi:hypothetical protein